MIGSGLGKAGAREDGNHEIPARRGEGLRARPHAGDLGRGPPTLPRGRVDRRGGHAIEHPALGRRPRDRRGVHRREAGRVLLHDNGGTKARVRDRGRRGAGHRRGHGPLLLGPEPGHGHRPRPPCRGDRRRLRGRARTGAALRDRPGRPPPRLLPDGERGGGHRHRDVESPRQRLRDEPGALRPDRGPPQHRRDQVQRSAGDVRPAHRPRGRPSPRQHRVRGRMARQHRRPRVAPLPLLHPSVPSSDPRGPSHARVH